MSDASPAVGRSVAPPKPALLKGGMVVCWIYALVLALLWVMPSGSLNDASLPGTQGVPGLDGLRGQAGILDATRRFLIPLIVMSIVVAYGLAKDRHWSRWTMMGLLLLAIVLLPPQLANPVDYAASVGFAGFGWWYLYRKPNVVEYYASIRESD